MQVKCTNKKCLHLWEYKGNVTKDKDYITCPKCHYKSMFKKALDRKKDIPLSIPPTNSLTHSLTHSLTDTPILNLNKLSPKMFGLEVEEDQEEEQEEIVIDGNMCDIHKLPASYDDLDRKWVCDKCIDESIDSKMGLKPDLKEKVFSNYSDFLREVKKRDGVITIKEIKPDVIRELPPKTHLQILEHQHSFF